MLIRVLSLGWLLLLGCRELDDPICTCLGPDAGNPDAEWECPCDPEPAD